MDVPQGAVLTHGDQPISEVIVAGHIARSQVLLVVFVDIEDCLPILCLLNPVAVAVIDKGSSAIGSSYRDGPVLRFPGDGLAAP